MDDEFLQNLVRLGIKELSINRLRQILKRLFDTSDNYLEMVNVGTYAYLIGIKVKVLLNAEPLDLVAIIFRGER